MKIKEVKKTKITATRIKNSLFKKNKELISLKKERSKLIFSQEERKKISLKESSVESSKSFLQSVKNVGKTLVSGPLSLIDKFKEFFGLILLGIVVNNLPAIIQKLQDIFVNIQSFFDQNPWIMNAIKFGFKMIGDGIMGLAKFIRLIGPYIGGSFKFALDTLRSARVQVESLISTFDDLNLSFGKLANDLNIDKIPDSTKDPSRYSNFIAGGGKKALEEKGLSVDEVVDQGKKNISRYDSGPRTPQSNPEPEKSTQKLARGGTVGNIPPEEGTFRGGPSDIAKNKNDSSKKRSMASPFTKTESGNARKARESVNYFETFNRTLNDAKENTILEKKNIESFEEMANNFKQFSELMQKLSTLSPGNRTRPDGSPSGADPIDVDPSEIVGYSGGVEGLLSSGRSTGPHIHMENGDGYERSGGVIPSDVLQNVLVNGKPINSYGTSRDPNTGHEGYDFLTPAGLPVTLTGGLKFVEYDKATSSDNNANFGDSLVIADSRGRKYLLAHMSGGPPNLQALIEKQNEQRAQKVQNLSTQNSTSGKASWYGPGFEGNRTSQGDIYNSNEYTAAIQQNLRDQFGVSLGSGKRGYARVTNTSTGKAIYVKINDVGPLTPGRVIDLSKKSFRALDPNGNPDSTGVLSNIKVEYLGEYKSGYPLGPINLTPASPPTPRNPGNPAGGVMDQLLKFLQRQSSSSLINPSTKDLASLSSISGGDIALTDLRGKESIGQDTDSTTIVLVPVKKIENIVTPILV